MSLASLARVSRGGSCRSTTRVCCGRQSALMPRDALILSTTSPIWSATAPCIEASPLRAITP
jgi:hypothetical protein